MYCTVDHIKAKLGEKTLANLSNDEGQGVVNEAYVEDLIVKKSNHIDTYLRKRYTLPLEEEHDLLEDLCVDLVRLALYDKRPGSRKAEEVAEIRRNVDSQLDKLRRGEIVLDVTTVSRPAFFKKNVRTKVFTDDVMEQFR